VLNSYGMVRGLPCLTKGCLSLAELDGQIEAAKRQMARIRAEAARKFPAAPKKPSPIHPGYPTLFSYMLKFSKQQTAAITWAWLVPSTSVRRRWWRRPTGDKARLVTKIALRNFFMVMGPRSG